MSTGETVAPRPTCATCIYWKPGSDPDDNRQGAFCDSDKLREHNNNDDFEDDALVYSYAEWGRFWTGPQFGCLHHV